LLQACPQDTRPAFRSPDLTAAGMTQRIRALQPMVEEVLGGKIPGPPLEVVVATREDVEALCFEQSVILGSALEGAARGDELRRQKRFEARGQARSVIGLVDAIDNRIHVIPANFKEEDGQDVVDVVLAHEAAHVFQYRAMGLARAIGRARTLDGFMGAQAVCEGHAEWVAKQVAARLGLSAAFADHQRRLVEIPDLSDDPAEEAVARAGLECITFAYVEGEKFVGELVAKLGYERAVARMFRDPPRSQHAVKHVEEYLAPKAGAIDAAEMGRRLKALVPSKYRTQAISAQPGLLRVALAPLDKKTLDAAMAGYRGGTLVFGRPPEKSDSTAKNLFAASFFTWDTPEQAARGFEASIEVRLRQDESIKDTDETATSEWGARETLGGVTSIFLEKKANLDGTVFRSRSVLALKGVACVEVSTINVDVTKQELVAFANRALAEVLAPVPESAPASAPADHEDAESRRGEAAAPLAPMARVEGEIAYEGELAGPAEITIRFWSLEAPGRTVTTATGANGRFSVELPTAGATRVGMIIADGEAYDAHLGSRLRVSEGRTVRYEVKRPKRSVVVVRDAATSRPIAGARAWSATWISSNRDWVWLPSREDTKGRPLVADTGGRVVVKLDGPEWALKRHLLVVAEGYAWEALTLPEQHVEELEITLRPGGSLRVKVANWATLVDPRLRLQIAEFRENARNYRFTYPSEAPAPDEHGEGLIEGLPPGTYGVLVVRGDYNRDGPVYGSALVQVEAGRTTEVAVATKPGPATVTVAGTITVPEAYRLGGHEVNLRLLANDPALGELVLEDEVTIDRKTRAARFTFEPAAPGAWKLLLDEAQWVTDVTVAPEGHELALQVPDPSEVEVEVIDAVTEEPIRRPIGHWRATLPDETRGVWSRVDLRWDAKAEALKLRAAPGAGKLTVQKSRYKSVTNELEIVAGKKIERTWKLHPAAEISVTLRVDGKPFGDHATLRLRARGGDRRIDPLASSTIEGVALFDELDAGFFELEVDAIPGFKRVPSRDVEAELRKVTEVAIDLEKEN
jgi:hypothetical protein